MENSCLEVILKWIQDLADGTTGHELEVLTTRSIRIVRAHKGFLLCDFTIHNGLSDENGNWHVGAIATLVDIIGSFASFSFTSYLSVTLDFSISYYSTAKVQEEVEVEGKVIGKKNELTSVIVEVRKKKNQELVAMGKQWMAVARRNSRPQASKL
ncbi:Thioesterase domain [Sesbania bispinosa]|nr:Thioesterase domain [Sesbania bispinosa]